MCELSSSINEDYKKIIKATQFAAKIHQNQEYKSGQPYLFHCLDVTSRVDGCNETIVALLHDTIEDAEENGFDKTIVYQEILAFFGKEIAEAVLLLSKVKGTDYNEYLKNLIQQKNTLVLHVKKADIQSNLDSLTYLEPGERKDRLTVKYTNALELFNQFDKIKTQTS
jgi:(p)ppGpp synthase/HD superfamily hydrolase